MTVQQFSSDSLQFVETAEFLPVDQAYRFDFQQTGNQLSLSWHIADGYYLYQHRFVADPSVALITQPDLPAGIAYNDTFFGDVVIYREHVTITYEIAAASADQPFVISYQGCADAGLCYPPTQKVVYLQAISAGDALTVQSSTTAEPTAITVDLPWWTIALIPLLFMPLVIIRAKRSQRINKTEC